MAAAAIEFAEVDVAAADRQVRDLRLGIVGAGKLATTVARAAVAAGYDVAMSGSGPADDIALTVDILAPGARAVTTDEVVRHADIIILAVPTHRFRELPRDLFEGKILIDAMNYWEPVDGADPELAAAADGTSMVVQQRFPSARVVKSLNQLGYHELDENRQPRGAPDRIAIAAAGDDRAAVRAVMRLIDRLGFDPVDAGPLEAGLVLEPDGSPFAVTYSVDELTSLISQGRDGMSRRALTLPDSGCRAPAAGTDQLSRDDQQSVRGRRTPTATRTALGRSASWASRSAPTTAFCSRRAT
jgi:predicted dinucleotide-binding enzyme